MSQRILVTGGAGFIGSHLVDRLIEEGSHVTVVDSLVTGVAPNLNPKAEFLQHDVRHEIPAEVRERWKGAGGFSEIYNLASPASPADFAAMPLFILETASLGHRHLLDLARDFSARILYASTSEVYGDPVVHPQPEDYFGNVNTVGPRSCYDEAKRYGEALTMAHRREFKTEVRIARIFNTYGPRMRPNDGRVIPNFFSQALRGEEFTVFGDGKQTRSLCFVEDTVWGLITLLRSNALTPVNIGNPHEITILEIAQNVARLTGAQEKFRFLPMMENDPKQRQPVIQRARALGWEPKVSLQDGLALTLKWWKEHAQ